MTRHPKTGQRRRVRRALQLDRLPPAMLERIRAARAAGQTWLKIEHESPQWKEWDQVPEKVKKLFASSGESIGHPERSEESAVRPRFRNDKSKGGRGKSHAELETGNRKPETVVVHRLPHSTLQRWYDLRVEQVRREQAKTGSA